MTAAGVQNSPPGALPAPLADRAAVASLRLPWLYLVSRRVPAALGDGDFGLDLTRPDLAFVAQGGRLLGGSSPDGS